MRLKLLLLAFLVCVGVGNAKNKTYVVVVGISDYRYPDICPSLRGLTITSAKTAATFFHDNSRCSTFMLLDKNATKDHIIRVLNSMFARADDSDIVMFVFSGHGYPGGITTWGFDGNANTAITYAEIQRIMKKCKASRKLILAEACYSGGIKTRDNTNRQRRPKRTSSEVMVYTSSRADEVSYVPGFMQYVIKGLAGRADNDQNSMVTARELFNYVNAKVITETNGKQHPQMWGKFDNNMVISYLR